MTKTRQSSICGGELLGLRGGRHSRRLAVSSTVRAVLTLAPFGATGTITTVTDRPATQIGCCGPGGKRPQMQPFEGACAQHGLQIWKPAA